MSSFIDRDDDPIFPSPFSISYQTIPKLQPLQSMPKKHPLDSNFNLACHYLKISFNNKPTPLNHSFIHNYNKLAMQQAERTTYAPKHSDSVKSQKHKQFVLYLKPEFQFPSESLLEDRQEVVVHHTHYLCLMIELHFKKNNHSSLV
jgi:hypothetical protein